MKTKTSPAHRIGREIYAHHYPGGTRALHRSRDGYFVTSKRSVIDGKLTSWLDYPDHIDPALDGFSDEAVAERRRRITWRKTARPVSRAEAARWLLKEAIPAQLHSAFVIA